MNSTESNNIDTRKELAKIGFGEFTKKVGKEQFTTNSSETVEPIDTRKELAKIGLFEFEQSDNRKNRYHQRISK
ncbi:hypothetical protein CNEO4_620022 [Clostridium neonatale]|nr:hypothetical protein CNEO4_620022 [Clostridium neonatale]